MRLTTLLEADDSRKALLALQAAIVEAGFDTELADSHTVKFTVPYDNELMTAARRFPHSEASYKIVKLANKAFSSIEQKLRELDEFVDGFHIRTAGLEIGQLYGFNVYMHIPDTMEDCYAKISSKT